MRAPPPDRVSRANRRPLQIGGGSGADERVPPGGGPSSPCRHKWSGGPRPAATLPDRGSPTGEAANTPTGGLAVLRALDEF